MKTQLMRAQKSNWTRKDSESFTIQTKFMSKLYTLLKFYILLILLIVASLIVFAQETRQLAVDKPQAIADLKSDEGAALVDAKWFVQGAHVVTADFNAPGPFATDVLAL